MTVPVAPPGLGDLENRFVPVKSIAFTHGGTDLDLTDATVSGNIHPFADELYVTLTGNLVAQLAGDAAPQTYPVTVGQVLQGIFVLIKSTSTADCIARRGV